MSLQLYDERLENVVTAPITGVRYALKRVVTTTPTNRDFSSSGAQLVSPPNGVALPPPGQWNPSGDASPPTWMLPFYDAYAIRFTATGNVTVQVGSEQAVYNVSAPPPEPEHFNVKVLSWDAAVSHTVFVCELSYSGSSSQVLLRASDIATGNISAAAIEKTGNYTFWCEYQVSGDAIVHITPQPAAPITTHAVIIGDTR